MENEHSCIFRKQKQKTADRLSETVENFVFRTVSRSKPRFRAKPKKNRALQAHFFFHCINSEIHKVNCRIAAREGGLGHALGIYEFALQTLFYACCRTKYNSQNAAFLTD